MLITFTYYTQNMHFMMNKKNEISKLHIEHFVKSLFNYLLNTTYRKHSHFKQTCNDTDSV